MISVHGFQNAFIAAAGACKSIESLLRVPSFLLQGFGIVQMGEHYNKAIDVEPNSMQGK